MEAPTQPLKGAADMNNSFGHLERSTGELWAITRRHAVEIASTKALVDALMKVQPSDNAELIAHLANARLKMEATLVNLSAEGIALPTLLSCFDSYLPAELKQKVLEFQHTDLKP